MVDHKDDMTKKKMRGGKLFKKVHPANLFMRTTGKVELTADLRQDFKEAALYNRKRDPTFLPDIDTTTMITASVGSRQSLNPNDIVEEKEPSETTT